jgi:hypothetical protein
VPRRPGRLMVRGRGRVAHDKLQSPARGRLTPRG